MTEISNDVTLLRSVLCQQSKPCWKERSGVGREGVEREGKSKEGMRNQKSPGEDDYRQHG